MVLFAAFVVCGVAVFVAATGAVALIGPIVVVFGGVVVLNTLGIVYSSLLYGELAGPLSIQT